MFPNAKPAVDAVGKLGALPGFLFSNPVVSGFMAMIMLPVFGAVAAIFLSSIKAGVGPSELFEIARAGAIAAVLFGAAIFGLILISALFAREERTARMMFVFGGLIGLGALAAADFFAADPIRAWLVDGGF